MEQFTLGETMNKASVDIVNNKRISKARRSTTMKQINLKPYNSSKMRESKLKKLAVVGTIAFASLNSVPSLKMKSKP